ncbi:MAG: TetR/AcrR family transcriptional regulator [Prevotella sp.]|nr:TetR/AcrR family transcriptional regulator [Prevotella sp.]
MTATNEYRQALQPLIIAEAERLFRQRGIKAVTMEEISKSLHISKRTIYELYTNKEEVLLEVLQQTHERKMRHLEEFSRHCNSIMDILIEVFRMQLEASVTTNSSFYHDLKKYPKAEALLKQYTAYRRDSSYDFFAKGVEDGYFLPTIKFKVFMHIMAAIEDTIQNDVTLKQLTFRDLLNNYIRILIRGICTQKGLLRFDQFWEQQQNKKL